MKNAIKQNAVFKWIGVLSIALLAFSEIGAQSLFHDMGEPVLDREQETYLKTITENPINHSYRFVRVNFDALEGNAFVFEPNRDEAYTVVKNERGEQYGSMTSWCGTISTDQDFGDVNMVINNDELVGHFSIGTTFYGLTPLGKGVHVFYMIDGSAAPAEECAHADDLDYDYVPEKGSIPETEDSIFEDEAFPKATGECKIRVLVGYTLSAQNQFTSILAELVNQVNLANASYDNAQVGFNIELAVAYRVVYTESGNLGTDLSRWRATADGFMDDVHSQRILWDADMCALIVNDGGGIAYLSLDSEDTFSVTGTGNFGVFTFHHELGHNMLCTHDLINNSQPGTAPYAGYGEPTIGCFRTIMAYQQACGTGICGRVNVWSRSIGTYNCGGDNYAKGGPNNRNRDRLVLSRGTINGHQSVGISTTYVGDYNWFDEEAVNFAAEENVSYAGVGTNRFDMFSGSEGSFRASQSVTLGEGFWARSGSTFTAYLESCTAVTDESAITAQVDPDNSDDSSLPTEAGDSDPIGGAVVHDLEVFPNPFKEITNVRFYTHDSRRVTITISDMLGREVMEIANASEFQEGVHLLEVPTSSLPSGLYLLSVRSGEDVLVKRIVKSE